MFENVLHMTICRQKDLTIFKIANLCFDMCLKQKRYFHIFSFLQEETCSKTFDILHEKLMPSGREAHQISILVPWRKLKP